MRKLVVMVVIVLSAFVVPQALAKKIYQCGSTFQDLPCDDGAEGKVIAEIDATKSARTEEQVAAEAKAWADDEKLRRERMAAQEVQNSEAIKNQATYFKLLKAVRNKQVMVGMTDKQVIKAWGEPDKVNRSSYGDQWIYYGDGNQRQYVYVSDGVVTGWN